MVDFKKIGSEIGELVSRKNLAYGNSFEISGAFLKLIKPNGIKPSEYTHILLVLRIFDKLVRIVNDPDAFKESPFADLAGYGILGDSIHRKKNGKSKKAKKNS